MADRGATEDHGFLSLRLRFGGVIDVVIALAVAATWIGCLGALHWVFDLFDHFRLQYLVVSLIAVLRFAWRRRWWLLAVGLATLVMNGVPIARTTWVAAPEPRPLSPWTLRVIHFNILTSNQQHEAVLDYFRDSKADVIVAFEMNRAWDRTLEKLAPEYPHRLIRDQEDNFGIGVFSRVNWHDPRMRRFAGESVVSFTATLVHDGQEVLLVATHPVPPMSQRNSRNAIAQLEAIGRFVGQQNLPALVVGDLNAAPWARAIRAMKRSSTLDFRTPQAVWVPTWMRGSPLMLPLDHALCTPPLVIERRVVGPDLGSDHRPLELDLRWQSID